MRGDCSHCTSLAGSADAHFHPARTSPFVATSSPPHSHTQVKKQTVVDMVTKGVIINVMGLGSTLLGIQALVGVLVAKTLSNASANPFIASAAGVYNPVLALDVFLVQVGRMEGIPGTPGSPDGAGQLIWQLALVATSWQAVVGSAAVGALIRH